MKSKKIFGIAFALIIIGGIISALTFGLNGSNSMGIYRSNGKWDYIKPNPVDGSNIITGTIEIPAAVEKMYIDVSFFDLQFVESDEYKIEYSYNSDYSTLEYNEENSALTLKSINNKQSMFSVGISGNEDQINVGYSAYNRYNDNKIKVYIDSNREFEKFNIITSHLNNVANVSNINAANIDFNIAHDNYVFKNIETKNANFNFQHSVIDIYDTNIDALQLFKAHTNTRVFDANISMLGNEMEHSDFTIENSSIGEANIKSKFSKDIFENTSVEKFSMISMSHSEFDYSGDMIKQMDLDMNQSNMIISMINITSDRYSFNFAKNFSEVLIDGSDLYTIYNGENKIFGNLNHSNINIYFN